MSAPFQRLPRSRLPARPRRPHPFADCTRHQRVIETPGVGRVPATWFSYGDGPPLLLVHGLMTHSYSWRYVLEPLGAHFRLIIPDLPGCGASLPVARHARFGLRPLARWLAAFIEAEGLVGVPAIGNSLGGLICLQLAMDRPRLLSKLVDLHSPALPEPRLVALRLVLSLPPVRWALERWIRRDPLDWVHRNVHYYDESLKSQEELDAWAAPLAAPGGARAFVRWLAHALAPPALALLLRRLGIRRMRGQGFPIPLQLIYAQQDPMVPPRVGQRLSALIPDARIDWLARSSHFAHVDSPERFVATALPFLLENTA